MVEVGLDLSDFIEPYLVENNQYQGGYYYSLPYSKSTEAVAVNRTVLKQHVAEIRALGIEISDNGFLSHDIPLTFSQLQALTPILVNSTKTTDVANYKCAFLMNYDSSGNAFINISRQLNAPYTNTQGQILVDNQTTRNMLTYIEAMFQARTFVLPTEWNDSYASLYFKYGDVCMTVGSSAGGSYNIPSTEDTQANLKFGLFDVDFIGVPQSVNEDNTPVTLSAGSTQLNFTGSRSAVQQGPNIAIFSSATANERLFAWLLIKWLTTTENTARWAMDTGYLPVRYSSYTADTEIQLTGSFSISYKDFLGIAQEYWANDGVVDWSADPEKADYVYGSMTANIAASQIDYSRFDPAFAATSRNASSATARDEAGYCLEYLYSPDYNPQQALQVMISTLIFY
jgi:multiple sugar transport system substrate-binding protein